MDKVEMDEINKLYKQLNIDNNSGVIDGYNQLNGIKTTLDCVIPTAFKINGYCVSNTTLALNNDLELL